MGDRFAQLRADASFERFVVVGPRDEQRRAVRSTAGGIENGYAAVNTLLAPVARTGPEVCQCIVGKIVFHGQRAENIAQFGVGEILRIVRIAIGNGGDRCASDGDLRPQGVDPDILERQVESCP